MRKYPRIELNPDAYGAIQAEALRTGRPVRDIASAAIMGHVSRESIEFMRTMAAVVPDHKTLSTTEGQQTIDMCATKDPNSQETIYEECGTSQHSESKPKRTPLRDDPAAQEKIKELIRSNPEMSYAAIAREVNKDRDAVGKFIKSLETGEEQSREARVDEQPGI